MNRKCWVIAGATSAIAKAFSRIVAEAGHDVILLGRDVDKLKSLEADLSIRYSATVNHLNFDAVDVDQHDAIAAACIALTDKPISVLIAFGYMPITDSLACPIENAQRTMQVNYNGAATLSLAFVPYLKEQKSSHLLVLGSVAGDRGRQSNFIYGSAKAGLEQFCEGLRAALHGTGISVTLMRLGYIDTPLTYGKPGYFLAASPEECARKCLSAANNRRAACYFPWFWRWIMLIFKWVPRFIFNRMKV